MGQFTPKSRDVDRLWVSLIHKTRSIVRHLTEPRPHVTCTDDDFVEFDNGDFEIANGQTDKNRHTHTDTLIAKIRCLYQGRSSD